MDGSWSEIKIFSAEEFQDKGLQANLNTVGDGIPIWIQNTQLSREWKWDRESLNYIVSDYTPLYA